MYFDQEDERDPFEAFGDAVEAANDDVHQDFEPAAAALAVIEPEAPNKVKTGFSWAGFAGGLAALVWIAGAIGGPLSYFGVDAVMAMDPAMQAGLIALAFGPALLFWVSASAAGEALKARRLAVELTKIAQHSRLPIEANEADAQRLTNTVKNEIESLNDAVASALDRLAELEAAAQRNAVLFGEAVAASRENTEAMTEALRAERDALQDLNGDLKGQTDAMAHSIGRQIRLMREASKLVKTEIVAAEDALETHLASFTASATVMGERTAAFHHAANDASAASASLNGAMTQMLDGLSEATRLTETARKSTEQAVLAANETAGAVRETTRAAVFEAKRAAQLIRAETAALQDAAAETLSKLQDAANAARLASEESEAAADRHFASIEKRLGALASAAGAKKAAQRPVERTIVERKAEAVTVEAEVTSLQAAASAALARTSARPQARVETAEQPRRVFKGLGGWANFMPPQSRIEETPTPANEDGFELVDFGGAAHSPDADLKMGAVNLVTNAGVDLDDVLQPADLERIARSSREGASSRRRAVLDAAPGAVGRIARHVKRNSDAQSLATQFRARPDLAKSDKKGEGSDLVRAYLLIDAALA
jgi:hypothetical protein